MRIAFAAHPKDIIKPVESIKHPRKVKKPLVALLGWLIYSGFNQGLGEEGLSQKVATVKHKEIDVVQSFIMVGKVMVPTTTTYYYVSVELNGQLIKIDVGDEAEYNSVKEGDTVYVGYTVGYFDKEKHYNSVFKTEALYQ